MGLCEYTQWKVDPWCPYLKRVRCRLFLMKEPVNALTTDYKKIVCEAGGLLPDGEPCPHKRIIEEYVDAIDEINRNNAIYAWFSTTGQTRIESLIL